MINFRGTHLSVEMLKGYLVRERLGTPGLESDSAKNNIHPNNKQKPKITNKNTGKRTSQCGQPV